MIEKNRNSTIDLGKYIAALFVVGIHTGLLKDINVTAGFIIVDIICRLAVPFFAICTGYFMGTKLALGEYKSVNNKIILLKQEKKLIYIYCVWTIVYLIFSLPMWIHTNWFSAWAFVDYIIGAILKGSHYQLWYLLGMIYALPILYLLLPILNCKRAISISILMYMIWLLYYSYQWCLPEKITQLLKLMSYLPALSAGIFLIIPLMLLGMKISRQPIIKLRNAFIYFMISFILLCTEAFWLKNSGYDKVSYLIFTYPTSYFLFECLLNIKTDEKVFCTLGKISLFVYCFHPILIETVGKVIDNSVVLYLITIVCVTLIGWGYMRIMQKIKRRK